MCLAREGSFVHSMGGDSIGPCLTRGKDGDLDGWAVGLFAAWDGLFPSQATCSTLGLA